MLLRCIKCQQLYSAQHEHEDGICPYCRQSGPMNAQEENGTEDMRDWRAPLYEYACLLAARDRLTAWERMEEILIRLGDYRDCARLLERAHARKKQLYEKIANDVQIGERRRVLENAVEQLRGFSGMPGAQDVFAAAEEKLRLICEREDREKAEALRRWKKREKRWFLLRIAAAAALVLWALAYVLVVFPGRLNRAESLMAQGQYEDALALCMKSEKVWETQRGGELLHAARIGTAETMRDEGRFQEAADMYHLLNMQDLLEETYFLWSGALAGQGDVQEAIRVLLRAEESDARWTLLADLYMDRADDAAAEAAARGTQDVEYARSVGAEIPALDAQLRYCHLLAEAGFDLAAVYPNGVLIEDAKLAALQIDAQDAQEAELPLESALVFRREETGSSGVPWLDYSSTRNSWRDRGKDSMYTVRLLPGHMFREGAAPARSFAQADTVLLMDGVYIESGAISVWTEMKLIHSVRLPKTLMTYPYFSAVSSVAAYDLHNPGRRQVFAMETSEAPCSDEAWRALHGNDGDLISGLSVRRGELNMEAMRSVLDELLLNGGANVQKGGDGNGEEP